MYCILPSARFIVPVSMIVCNDVMAYMFGFFFGRTPLIKLSPKKTWEGFIGGGFATVVFGLGVSFCFPFFKVLEVKLNLFLNDYRFPISCANTLTLSALSSLTRRLARWRSIANLLLSSALKNTHCQIHSFLLSAWSLGERLLSSFHSCFTRCQCPSLVRSLDPLEASLQADLSVHSRLRSVLANQFVIL